jgi:uncharacterized OB-fold protein
MTVAQKLSRPAAEYARRLADGIVAFQACLDCGQAIFHPRVLCTSCGSTRLEWRASAGRGAVYSATTVYLRDVDPYTVALVDLDEGVRVMARVDDAVPGEPPIDSAVRVVAGEIAGEPALRATLAGASDA